MTLKLTDDEREICADEVARRNANRNADEQLTAEDVVQTEVSAIIAQFAAQHREAELAKLRAIGEAIIDAPPEVAKDILTYAQKRLAE